MAKPDVTKMSQNELKKSYEIGAIFLTKTMQVWGSDLAEDGSKYNPERWLRGLRRLEKLEIQMKESNDKTN